MKRTTLIKRAGEKIFQPKTTEVLEVWAVSSERQCITRRKKTRGPREMNRGHLERSVRGSKLYIIYSGNRSNLGTSGG